MMEAATRLRKRVVETLRLTCINATWRATFPYRHSALHAQQYPTDRFNRGAARRISTCVNPDTNAPFDLSHSVLRNESSIHIEDLRNMGECA